MCKETRIDTIWAYLTRPHESVWWFRSVYQSAGTITTRTIHLAIEDEYQHLVELFVNCISSSPRSYYLVLFSRFLKITNILVRMLPSPTVTAGFDVEANTLQKQGHKHKESKLPDTVRNSTMIVVDEFLGTFLFLFMSFVGAQTAVNNNDPANPDAILSPMSLLYIAVSFSSALAANIWIFYRVTGGMFNPAVSSYAVLPLRLDIEALA